MDAGFPDFSIGQFIQSKVLMDAGFQDFYIDHLYNAKNLSLQSITNARLTILAKLPRLDTAERLIGI